MSFSIIFFLYKIVYLNKKIFTIENFYFFIRRRKFEKKWQNGKIILFLRIKIFLRSIMYIYNFYVYAYIINTYELCSYIFKFLIHVPCKYTCTSIYLQNYSNKRRDS